MSTKVYITGTSTGLGKALALQLLENDSSVVIGIGRNCSIKHQRYSHLHMDLTDLNSFDKLTFESDDDTQTVVLINNAGTLGEIKPIGKMSERSISDGIFLNLTAPMILSNRFTKAFEGFDKIKTIIINISSGAAWNPYDGWGMYCASKAGLDMFAAVLNQEIGLHFIKNRFIFSIAPGVIDTGMQDQIRASNKKDFNNVDRFIELKKDGALRTTASVSEKIIRLIYSPEIFEQYKLDINEL